MKHQSKPPAYQDAFITGSVRNISYDKNGNILSLTRLGRITDGWKVFDSLSYVYNGNRLKAVDDDITGQTSLTDFHDVGLKYSQHGKAEYEYDANGNMTLDLNRSLHIQYNTGNNLIHRIIHHQGSIVNHYTLGGAKLGKMLFDRYDNLTYHEQYYGDLVIKGGQPTRILHGDGTINLNGSSVEYHYHLKDHLGNVRLVITPSANNKPQVLQANDYYPFGMVYNINFQSSGGAHLPNKYLYNSKEEQEMPGKWLDYGWRMYDAQLARFHSVDPMAAKFPFQSPYLYASNNPVRFIDYKGLYTNEPREEDKPVGEDEETKKARQRQEQKESEKVKRRLKQEERLKNLMAKAYTPSGPNPSTGWAMGYSISGGGFHAAMKGRDPFDPTDQDKDAAGNAFMAGVAVIVAIPGGGGAYIGNLTLKGGRYVITYAPRIYNSTLTAVNLLKNMGASAYIYVEGSIIAQGSAGVALGVTEAYFDLPPGGIDHPFIITHFTANMTNATIHFLQNKP